MFNYAILYHTIPYLLAISGGNWGALVGLVVDGNNSCLNFSGNATRGNRKHALMKHYGMV